VVAFLKLLIYGHFVVHATYWVDAHAERAAMLRKWKTRINETVWNSCSGAVMYGLVL